MNLFAKYQRVFIIIGFLLLVFFLGYLLFAIFIKPSLPSSTTGISSTSTAANTGKLPNAGAGTGGSIISTSTGAIPSAGEKSAIASAKASGGLTQTTTVVDSATVSPTLSASGKGMQYYNQNDGKFYKIDSNGNVTALSDKVFYNVSNVVWSSQKDKAIIEYPDGSKTLYNFDTEKQVTLPSHWSDFDFSTDDSQIVFKTSNTDSENNYLAIANDDGSNAKTIEAIGNNGDTVVDSWSPTNQIIAMYTKGVDLDRQEVYFVGQNDENFKSTVIEGRGFESQWSTSGNQLAYSVYSSDTDMKPELWAVDSSGDSIGSNRRDLGLATWASKCTYADDTTMYCGVPESLPTGSGLFTELAQTTTDDLYKVNTQTGEKTLIAVPNGSYTMSNLQVSSDNSTLYFQDSNTKTIHKVQLK
jgi:hypothetical protein